MELQVSFKYSYNHEISGDAFVLSNILKNLNMTLKLVFFVAESSKFSLVKKSR